jgi:hypothetical protein
LDLQQQNKGDKNMTTSTNPKIQKLMNDVASLDDSDPNMIDKLNVIAQMVAAEQRKIKAELTGTNIDDSNLVDPSDAFACEGCQ